MKNLKLEGSADQGSVLLRRVCDDALVCGVMRTPVGYYLFRQFKEPVLISAADADFFIAYMQLMAG